MSTSYSPEVQLEQETYDKFGYPMSTETVGAKLEFHHTSDVVSWIVNGEVQWRMMIEEYHALCQAIDADRKLWAK